MAIAGVVDIPRRFVFELVVVALGLLLVAGAATQGGRSPSLIITAVIGVTALYLGSRRPAAMVIIMLVSVVGAPLLPAALLLGGLPAGIDRQYGAIKDLCVLSIVVSAATVRRRPGPRDAVELAAACFLLLLTLYALFPIATNGFPVPERSVRNLAWRLACEWVILLVALRRTRLTTREREAIRRTLLILGLVVAAACIYEYVAETAWNRFLTTGINVPRYQAEVLGSSISSTDLLSHNTFAGVQTVRVGGLSLNPLATGALMLIIVASLTAGMAARPTRTRVIAFGVTFAGLGLTLTRSALIGAVVAVLLIFVGRRPRLGGRLTAGLGILGLALIVVPVLSSSHLFARFGASTNGQDSSAVDHSKDVSKALAQVPHQLLGGGLGTGPGVGAAHATVALTAENAYLQISLETGIAGALLFTLLLLVVARDSWKRARIDARSAVDAAAAVGAVAGVMVMSLFLDIWVDYATVLVLGVVLALAVGEPVVAEPPPAPEPVTLVFRPAPQPPVRRRDALSALRRGDRQLQ